MASAGFLLFGGRAADLLGRRRILAAGLALYSGAAFAGGLATSPGMLLVARAVQGLGGAPVFPTTWHSSTPPSEKAAPATVPWESGEGRAPQDSSSACCSAAS
ncbi:MFS transporter [Streptomyces sp. NBC_01294]|uniref:MFS transporter n=1 Tax=Streptomyces sp. NBC_01294 TaxID=2903815 RepID=UPI003FA3A449